MAETVNAAPPAAALYRILWRWHFYAGLFCMPFVLLLALTGSVYLFKPQIETWLDAPYDRLASGAPAAGQLGRASADALASAAVAAVPDSRLAAFILPTAPDVAVRVLVDQQGEPWRLLLHPQTAEVLHAMPEGERLIEWVKRLHGELLLGDYGSLLVELAACWAIVMVLTGLYLWWPRQGQGVAGVLYPRLQGGSRRFWRDLHAVTGFWISALALVLLVTGLPWTQVWGSAFAEFRESTGLVKGDPDWRIRGHEHVQHRGHDHTAEPSTEAASLSGAALTGTDVKSMPDALNDGPQGAPLEVVVARARGLDFAPPVYVRPPSAGNTFWTIRSDAQNRPLRADAHVDAMSGEIIARQQFNERHIIDQVVGFGIAAHEGQLFGWLNQLIGVVAALGLALLSISGLVMWRRRAPDGVLGAPPVPRGVRIGRGFVAIILLATVLLPLLGASLIAIVLIERLLLTRWPAARRWLGLASPT